MICLRKLAMPALVLASLLVGCGDRRAVDADTFKQALQHYYDGHPECVALPIDLTNGAVDDADGMYRDQINALIKSGLLVAAGQNGAKGSAVAGAGKTSPYVPTAAGKAAIHAAPDRFLGGSMICYAHRKIVDIVSFTQSTEMLGSKVVEVTYSYTLTKIAPWARIAAIQAEFPAIKTAVAAPTMRAAEGLVQTDHGWVDEHAAR